MGNGGGGGGRGGRGEGEGDIGEGEGDIGEGRHFYTIHRSYVVVYGQTTQITTNHCYAMHVSQPYVVHIYATDKIRF